ncbi:hypothetical protein L1987_06194 [Smallanthus sonchifolius]|uniref:Uncharacterized protein n=1 Tax=Smallanthus sonchifolius TaxID=185202 RepID=A0ACB9JXN1_9ASTR|nr:hypothetical protein L1987_06194 [Smallanthus sonchifolius]
MFMFLSTATIRKRQTRGSDNKFEDGETDKSKKLRDVYCGGDSQESTRFYSGVRDCRWTRKARKRSKYLRRIQKKAFGLLNWAGPQAVRACKGADQWAE